jgi:transmembrane sensor
MADPADTALLDEAIAWRLRLDAADESGWEQFTEWLEADPRHNDAYEAVMADEAAWTPVLAQSAAADEADGALAVGAGGQAASAPPRWRWAAAAAGIAATALVAVELNTADATYAIETAPGETRTVALPGGSTVELNGGSRIVLDRDNPRRAKLAAGEARFTVVHDPAHPFVVSVGDRRLVDLGTRFNVVHGTDGMRVGVAAGAVRYEGLGRPVELHAGEVLSERGGVVRFAARPAETIGSWAHGALIYDEARLAEVASDLSRGLGVRVDVAPALADERFSGVIQTTGGKAQVKPVLGPLLRVKVEDRGGTWHLSR